MLKTTINQLKSFNGYLIILSLILLTGVSYFSFSMEDEWAFDVFSDDVMISNMIYDSLPENKSHSSIVVQQALEGGGIIKDIYSTGEGVSNLEFINYTSQVALHGITQSAISGISPFPHSITLELLWLTNCILLAVVLLFTFTQLDKLLATNYRFLLVLLSAFFFADVMKYGSNLYWNGWAIFLPFAVSLWFVNSKYISSKYYLPFIFLTTFAPLLLKLLFSYEFVSTIMVAQTIPFIFYLINNKVKIKRAILIFFTASLGALAAFAATVIIQLVQSYIAFGSGDIFFQRMSEILLMRVLGDATSSVELVAQSAAIHPISVIIKFLTMQMASLSIASILYIHIMAAFALTFIYSLFNGGTKGDHRLLSFGLATAISLLAPLSWYLLASPHAYIHAEQCVLLWYVPSVYMIIIYIISCTKRMYHYHKSEIS